MNQYSQHGGVDGHTLDRPHDPLHQVDTTSDAYQTRPQTSLPLGRDLLARNRTRRAIRSARILLQSGSNEISARETLEVILRPVSGNRDVCQIAQILLNTFQTFGGIVNAPEEKLMAIDGMTEGGIASLRAVGAAALHLLRQRIILEPIPASDASVKDYLVAKFQHEKIEVFCVLYFNACYRLIGDEVLWRGTVSKAPCNPREVIRRCLELGATSVIVAHNHPSYCLRPSDEDRSITRRLAEVMGLFDIVFVDHLIVGNGETTSLRAHGLI